MNPFCISNLQAIAWCGGEGIPDGWSWSLIYCRTNHNVRLLSGAVQQDGVSHIQCEEEQPFLGSLLIVKAISKPNAIADHLTFNQQPYFTACSVWGPYLICFSEHRKILNNTDYKINLLSDHHNIIRLFFSGECHFLNSVTFWLWLYHLLLCLQRFILSRVVKGANIAMLAASTCSAFFVLAMAYLGCRSLPRCSCYDSVTGMVSEEPGNKFIPTECGWEGKTLGTRCFLSPTCC